MASFPVTGRPAQQCRGAHACEGCGWCVAPRLGGGLAARVALGRGVVCASQIFLQEKRVKTLSARAGRAGLGSASILLPEPPLKSSLRALHEGTQLDCTKNQQSSAKKRPENRFCRKIYLTTVPGRPQYESHEIHLSALVGLVLAWYLASSTLLPRLTEGEACSCIRRGSGRT